MLYGHTDKIEMFTELARRHALHHAYLLYGDAGIGKYTFARQFAYALELGSFEEGERALLDAIFVTPQEDKQSIGIQDLREVKKFLYQRPLVSPRRLVIIDNAELLTPEAQGSLLKFVEEAPTQVTFFFIARHPNVLLPPLASRLMKVYFSRFSTADIEAYLKKEQQMSAQQAKDIAARSFGSIGRALSLLTKTSIDADNLTLVLEEDIVERYITKRRTEAPVIVKLFNRLVQLKSFPLNPKLQRKAIDHIVAR